MNSGGSSGTALLIYSRRSQAEAIARYVRSLGVCVIRIEGSFDGGCIPQDSRADLAVLDGLSPWVTGQSGIERLRESLPQTPIIVVTPHAGHRVRRQAMSAGGVTVLQEPLSERLFESSIRELLKASKARP